MTDKEAEILTSVLRYSRPVGRFTVVQPKTKLARIDFNNVEDIKQSKVFIQSRLHIQGLRLVDLVDRFFERNTKSVQISIPSCPEDGYLVDYEGKYSSYFTGHGGGWEKWYQENPKACGMTTVSLPVHDEAKGLIVVYVGSQRHWLAGSGEVLLYRYENGTLHELKKVMMWVS